MAPTPCLQLILNGTFLSLTPVASNTAFPKAAATGAVAASPAIHRQLKAEGLRIGIILSGGNLDRDSIS